MNRSISPDELKAIFERDGIRVAHAIAGRTRIKLDRRLRDEALMRQIADILVKSLPDVTAVEVKPITGSIIIEHGPLPVSVKPQVAGRAFRGLRALWFGATIFVELPLALVLAMTAIELLTALAQKRRISAWQAFFMALDYVPFLKVPDAVKSVNWKFWQ